MGADQEGSCGFRALYPGELDRWPGRIFCGKAVDSRAWNLSGDSGDRGWNNWVLSREPPFASARYRDLPGNCARHRRDKINLHPVGAVTLLLVHREWAT